MHENLARKDDTYDFESMTDEQLSEALVILEAGHDLHDVYNKEKRKALIETLSKNYSERLKKESANHVDHIEQQHKSIKEWDKTDFLKLQEENIELEANRLKTLRDNRGEIFK